MSPIISIIIPIYNKAPYLHKCIQSVINQTFQDFEAILVDDGSDDGSAIICDDYAVLDSRIRAIHQRNAGVSSARQTGLIQAIGEYVIHIDPDDYVKPEFLQRLYSAAKMSGSDMVICDYAVITGSAYEICSQEIPSEAPEDIIPELFTHLHGSCWNKLIRRNIISNIEFPKGINMCEDLIFIFQSLLKCNKVTYVPEALYNYVTFPNSLSRCSNKQQVFQLYTAYQILVELAAKHRPDVLFLINGAFCGHILPRIYSLSPKIDKCYRPMIKRLTDDIWTIPNITLKMKLLYIVAGSRVGYIFRMLFKYL